MDRYITHLSPKRNPATSKRGAEWLEAALSLDSPLLSPQNPKKPGSPLRQAPRPSLIDNLRAMEPVLSHTKLRAEQSAKARGDLRLQYVVDVPTLRDDFYSTLLAVCPVTGDLAVGLRGEVRIWSGQTGVRVPMVPYTLGSVTCLEFNANGVLAIGYHKGRGYLYDPITDTTMCGFKLDDGTYATCIKFKSDYVLYAGDNKGKLHVISTFRYQQRKVMRITATQTASSELVSGIEFNHDKSRLLCGSNDGSLSIWDSGNSQEHKLEKRSTIYHGSAVKAITRFPTLKNLMVTGGGRSDRSLRVIDLETEEVVMTHMLGSQVTGFAWLSNFELFIALGHSRGGQARIGQLVRFQDGECQVVFDAEDRSQRTVYCAQTKGGFIAGLNTNTLYFFGWGGTPQGNAAKIRRPKLMTSPIR